MGKFEGHGAAHRTSIAAFVFAILSACISGGLVIASIFWAVFWIPAKWEGYNNHWNPQDVTYQWTNFALALVLLVASLTHGRLEGWKANCWKGISFFAWFELPWF